MGREPGDVDVLPTEAWGGAYGEALHGGKE